MFVYCIIISVQEEDICFSLDLCKNRNTIYSILLYKARETYIFFLYTYNYAIYIHFTSIQLYAKQISYKYCSEIGSELYNCALYNCSEIGQRIIQLQRNRPANYTLVYIANYTVLYLLWSAIMQSLLQHTNMNFLFAICESCPFLFLFCV